MELIFNGKNLAHILKYYRPSCQGTLEKPDTSRDPVVREPWRNLTLQETQSEKEPYTNLTLPDIQSQRNTWDYFKLPGALVTLGDTNTLI